MKIEIWSDVVCPWCYIGKRRLETALAGFGQAHPDAEVEVVWRSYELDPVDHLLAEIAAGVGLDEVRVKEVLATGEYADAVEADVRQAGAYGATGVPFFVVDQRYGVAGAQPADVLGQVLERAWTESRPALDVVGGSDACGPDGCPV